MKKKTKKTVAFVSEITLDQEDELLFGIMDYAHEKRNFIINRITPEKVAKGCSFTDTDGIIRGLASKECVDRLKTTGLPIIDLTGQSLDDPAVISADADVRKAGIMAAERLLQRGFSNFAFYAVSVIGNAFCEKLGAVFASRIAKSGFKCSVFKQDWFAKYDTDSADDKREKEFYAACDKFLASLPAQTAVFCNNDSAASIILQRCLHLGKSVPKDIAILGMNNNKRTCICSSVTLSSIDLNLRKLGYAAMRILDSAINHPVKPKRRRPFLVPPMGVVERESTAIYPVDPPWLADALSLIDTDMSRPLSPTDLANAARVSTTTLQSAFHKVFGTSAGQYILAAKMREAKRLVEEGKLSIKEISAKAGFESQNYFARAYRKHYGHPPSADRKIP